MSSPSAQYIRIYDQTVKYVREWADPEHKVQFVGLALENPAAYDFYTQFLNASNHLPDTPLGQPHPALNSATNPLHSYDRCAHHRCIPLLCCLRRLDVLPPLRPAHVA